MDEEGELSIHLSGAHTYARAGEYEGVVKGKYHCLTGTQKYEASFSAAHEHPKAESGVQFSGVVAATHSECLQATTSGKIEWGDGQSSAAELSAGELSATEVGITSSPEAHLLQKPGS